MRKLVSTLLRVLFFWTPAPQHPLISKNALALRWRLGWIKAQWWYRPSWGIKSVIGLGPCVHWGKRVSIQGCAQATGPGKITLSDDVILDSRVTLFTHAENAHLKIGSRSYVNGTRFGCMQSIEIGENCLLGDARLMDTDFHSVKLNRFSLDAVVPTSPIVIENNVWIAAGAGILKGVRVGEGSVVGFQSVVTRDVPKGRIVAGHPAQDVGPVQSD